MKKKDDLDEPREYFERNVLLILIFVAISSALMWLCVDMLRDVNPWGTLVGVPGIIFTFQTLWLITNPYAIVYEDRFEIKHSFFYGKVVYFLDLKGVKDLKASRFTIVYNDDEPERLPLLGMRGSHKKTLIKKLEEKIEKSKASRLF
ncbi:MAG: hypothetical protein JST26_08880 [Bacteroidetes bacterium]|nr:hypothetical protein [Bacteroidota bacterium]